MPIKKKLFNAPFILSFGSGAGKILSQIPSSNSYYKIAINSSERDLSLIDGDVDQIIRCGNGNGSGMDPTKGEKDYKEKSKTVLKTLDDVLEETKTKEVDFIPVIASLGHGFGSGSFATALSELKNKFSNSIIFPFVVTPFTWEGFSVIERAFTSLKEATKINTCFVISNEEVGSIYKDIGSSYNKINVLIGNLVSNIIKSLSATDGILQTIDKADMSKFVSGDLATIRYINLDSAKDLSISVIQDKIDKKWLKVEGKAFKFGGIPRKINVFYILDGQGPFSPQTLLEIHEYIGKREYINQDEVKPLLIERKSKGCDFIWLESGYELACGKNIYGVY